ALQVAERALEAARKSVTETGILYRQGLARAIELIDANDSRFVAEVNFATAELSLALSYLGLRHSLGLDVLGTEMRCSSCAGSCSCVSSCCRRSSSRARRRRTRRRKAAGEDAASSSTRCRSRPWSCARSATP